MKTPPKKQPEISNVDPTPIPLRRVPVLSMEEAGNFLSAFAKDRGVMPADFRRKKP